MLVRLERDGTARYGSAALAVDNAKAEGETMLLYFHAFAFGGSGNLDALHTRLMNLPLMQAVPLVRDAAMLIFCNNPKRDTADLVSRLRRYVQPRRWLLHSPDNAGYECGEFASPDACPSDCEWGLAAGGATPAGGIGAQTNKMEVGGEGEGGCTGVGLLSKAYARMRRDMMLQVAVYVFVYTRVCICDMYV